MSQAKPTKSISQESLLKEYYISNPRRIIAHPEIVDWVSKEYLRRTGKVFRDPDRGVRKLAQSGFLIKHGKGEYSYDPEHVTNRELEDFTPAQKEEIKARDGYRCVMCGKGIAEGVELHVDHIKPKDLGGKAEIINGQTLCAQHNFQKKNLKQTETGKKMFIRLYALAKESQNTEMEHFCARILQVFEDCAVNGHIEWKK